MARRSRLSLDRVDADRIGRTGGRRPRERSVNSELARRLTGFKGRAKVRGRESGGRRQRVVVKALVSRHKAGKARGSIARHASYLGRESASADGKPGVFYDASRERVNARKEVVTWAEDRHHFRLIVSPEHGKDIPDMTAYVREVMRRVQRDLDTKLEWVAVNHHNTDNPHAHVMVRGKREDGADLVIPRRYISYGIRDRASEVATELLGERSALEVHSAKAKEVEAERFTSLDRMIERHLERGPGTGESSRIDVSPSRHIGFGADDRDLVVGRLQFLERLELAHKGRGARWEVEGNFSQVLRELGARNDIIHQLYASLGNDAGQVERMNAGATPSKPVSGIVIARGSVDEIGEDRFIVVRDSAGRSHYGRVRDGESYRELQIGSLAELGAGTQRRREVAAQIVSVAKANGGIYSATAHQSALRASAEGTNERQAAWLVLSAEARLGFVAGHEGSGVRAVDEGKYAVDAETFGKFSQRGIGRSSRTDVRTIEAHTLADQVQARAVTWLDRQAFGDQPDTRLNGHPAVEEAIQRRREWLTSSGYADVTAHGKVALRSDALGRLARQERDEVASKLAHKYDRPVVELPAGEAVSGEYRGMQQLHRGKLAVIVTDDAVVVGRIRKTPDIATGSTVNFTRADGRNATVQLVTGRSLDARTRNAIDGMEAGR